MNFLNTVIMSSVALWVMGQFFSLIRFTVRGKKNSAINYLQPILNIALVTAFGIYFHYQGTLDVFLSGIALNYQVIAFNALVFGGLLRSHLMNPQANLKMIAAYGTYFSARETTMMVIIAAYSQNPCLVAIALLNVLSCLGYTSELLS